MGNRDYNLQEIPIKINKIETVTDLARLADFVYSTIPHAMDNGIDLNYNVAEMYWQFINKKKFGWCYMHAMYMHLLLKEYGRVSFLYDYGLQEEQLTHSVVIVAIKDNQYLIDPYFNRYYVNKKKEPLSFRELKVKVAKGSEEIKAVYGAGKKQVKQGDIYIEMTGPEFFQSVLNSWKVNQKYDEIMVERFNSTDPLLLLPRKIQKVIVLNKIDGTKYYEFF